jgi:hypothetical protein
MTAELPGLAQAWKAFERTRDQLNVTPSPSKSA